jgi:riboflavin kinase/FMN adenylyltransferase
VGRRPTFQGEEVRAEAHVIDWSGDLYGRRIDISFAQRIRSEEKFDGVDALRQQIARDVDEARRRLEGL